MTITLNINPPTYHYTAVGSNYHLDIDNPFDYIPKKSVSLGKLEIDGINSRRI